MKALRIASTILGVLILFIIIASSLLFWKVTRSADISPQQQSILDNQVLGQGQFRYRIRRDKLLVPDAIRNSWNNVHGITKAPDGTIYVTYSTWGEHNEETRAIVHFDRDGDFIGTLGNQADAIGEPHGLEGRTEGAKFYLYHSNNNGEVFKTDQQMTRLWSSYFPQSMTMYERDWQATRDRIWRYFYQRWNNNLVGVPGNYTPCNVAFHPDGETFYMADCYSESYIHKFSTQTGEYTNFSFGGTGAEPDQYNTPHGLIWDTRKDQLLIADRGNSRLQYTNEDGVTQSIITHPDIVEPCDLDLWGDYLLIPDLSGHLLVLDGNNQVISKINVADVMGAAGYSHPHDAIFLENGDIVVGTWFDGSLTYWERLPTNES